MTSAWQVYTSAHQHAFREAVEHSSQTAPAHRWAEAQGSYPALIPGSSVRVDYRRRLKLNTQDSAKDVLFRQKMRYPERGAGGFSSLNGRCRGEQDFSACAAAGGVGVSDGVRVSL